jgi:flagellin
MDVDIYFKEEITMRINHNISAMNTHRQMSFNSVNSAKNMERLSSGFKINRAGDDAAGLAISEKMRGQIRGLDMATKNAQDGISLIQTAEGALNETHAILQRIRELAVQSANDTNDDTVDRKAMAAEVEKLRTEVTRIGTDTQFNGKALLASDTLKLTFHIGANENQRIEVEFKDMQAAALKLDTVDLATRDGANSALTVLDKAINSVSEFRSTLGATQNRLEHTINNLGTSSENLQAAESRIRDVDMAKEMMQFSKNNILSQAAQAMLAQANQMPQSVLQLLR